MLGAAAPVVSQVPVTPPADTVRNDTTHADSLHPKHDTLTTTQRLLQVQQDQNVQRPTPPLAHVETLQPAGTRIVFNRDSIDWATAETVSELLNRVPGVYLEQGGWLGRPVLPNYQGRGAGSVEYYLDGRPLIGLGPDSLAPDPSAYPLEFLDHVEIERGPGLLRVYLYSREHDRAAPRTKIGVATGDRGLARYFGSFERNYTGGISLVLAADYLGVNSPAGGTGGANITNGWAQLGWMPTPHFSIQGQYFTQDLSRDSLLDAVTGDSLSPALSGTRTDENLRASWQQRTDGLGPRLDFYAAQTFWKGDSLQERLGVIGGIATLRRANLSAELTTLTYSAWTQLDNRINLAWAPSHLLSGSVEFINQDHSGNRASDWGTARLGLQLPAGFRIGGVLRDGHRVQNPSIVTDSAQKVQDGEVTAAIDLKALTIEAGFTRDNAWQPTAYEEFTAIPGLAPLPRTDWITGHIRLAPLGWLTFESVYEEPRHILPDGVPPQHTYTTVTGRSRFLRNFPSGIFELKAQVALEAWSPGLGGHDTMGAPIPLPAASFYRADLQIKIGPFIAFFDRVNLKAVKTGSVPGYPIVLAGSTYGMRWEFSN